MKRITMLAVLALTLALGAVGLSHAPAASAAPGNGAQVIDDHQCQHWIFEIVRCLDAKGVSNTTTTPSGNVSTTFNGTICASYIAPGNELVLRECQTVRYHSLSKNGVLHEEGNRATFTSTLLGQTTTCSVTFHLANGRVQYERETFC
jgi:hypothetical protein